MSRIRLAACIVAALFMLSGCSLLPQSGEVHAVEGSTGKAAPVGLSAQPPMEGASPEEIVSGFVAACQNGFDDDFSVARQFLSPEASQSWVPTGQVRIYPDTQSVELSRTDSGAVHATVGSAGTLTRTGTFAPAPASSMVASDFSLARNSEGQWRIVVLEDGIFLSQQSFLDVYVEAPLHFLSPSSPSLVADLRFFPKRTFASDAVRALLAGPSEWLAPAVRTAVPADTALAKEGVEVTDGRAIVHLSRAVLSASDEDLAKLFAQISATLSSSATIDSVELAVESALLEIEAASELTSYPFGAYPLVGLASGAPAAIHDQKASELMPVEALGGRELSGLASAYESVPAHLAALAASGGELVALRPEEGTVAVVATGEKLVAPSFDSHGWMWSGEESNDGHILVRHDDQARAATLDVPWLAGAKLRYLSVSREGARLVTVIDGDDGLRILVSAISRDASFTPTAVGDPMVVSHEFTSVADVAWVSQTQLVVLGQVAGEPELAVHLVQVGGLASRLVASPKGTVGLSAGRGQQSITVVTDSGEAFVLNGGAWNQLAGGVTDVAYPG